MTRSGLLLSDDLIFTSKITGTAKAHGLTITTARTLARFEELRVEMSPTGVIVDLHFPGLNIAELVASLPGIPVTGYGSHVDVNTLKAARAAGCTRVMPRSQFVAELETKLSEWV
ncbi:MAG: response regulator [Fimbriiglobus sp.]